MINIKFLKLLINLVPKLLVISAFLKSLLILLNKFIYLLMKCSTRLEKLITKNLIIFAKLASLSYYFFSLKFLKHLNILFRSILFIFNVLLAISIINFFKITAYDTKIDTPYSSTLSDSSFSSNDSIVSVKANNNPSKSNTNSRQLTFFLAPTLLSKNKNLKAYKNKYFYSTKTNNELLKVNTWINYFSQVFKKIDNKLLTNELIKIVINEFNQNIVNYLKDNQYVILYFRLQFSTNNYVTLGKVNKIYNNSKIVNDLVEYYENILINKADDYKILPISEVIITYQIKEKSFDLPDEITTISEINKFLIPKTLNKNTSPSKNINKFIGYNLPNTMNYLTWGQLKFDEPYLAVVNITEDKFYRIIKNKLFNVVELFNKDKVVLKFIDYYDDINDLNTFVRLINNHKYYYKNNIIELKIMDVKTSIIKPIKKDNIPDKDINKINKNIITLDIETRVLNNVLIPYCICFYDGKDKYSFYSSDYKDHFDMIKGVFYKLLIPKYNNYIVYTHNLSNFDGIFLIESFIKFNSDIITTDLKPTIKDGKMINLEFKFNKCKINFRDSLSLLPLSLYKLAKQFKVKLLKTIFPYHFVNDKFNYNIDLNYTGIVPALKFFIDLGIDEYNKYKNTYNNNWNLKSETINYCLNDCISLHQVISEFAIIIAEKFKINIHKYPTLSSLAFAIFRLKFLKNVRIPIIIGSIYDDLKQSYTGGSTEMYIPCIDNNILEKRKGILDDIKNKLKIFWYDVNSLYPYSMKKFMPAAFFNKETNTNYISYFEGDIFLKDNNAYGFFEVEVTAPDFLEHPILQLKFNTSLLKLLAKGIRTISPLGKWKGMYYSEEIENAKKIGYKFKVIKGYLFDKQEIFNNYINELYKIKESYSKNDPWYLIAKLLMNSLYGRFGMNPILDNHIIIDDEELEDYIDEYEVNNIIQFNNKKLLISYIDKTALNKKLLKFAKKNVPNVSVAIASAITANSRIFMSQFKNIPNLKIYYTDTDSLFTNKPLNKIFIGKELGKFKLENIFNDAVFLGPKVYGGITDTGIEIVKIKGYKNLIEFKELKSLLNKSNTDLLLNHEKWYKNIEHSNITIKEQIYTLTATENKRELIYNNNKLVATKPFILK